MRYLILVLLLLPVIVFAEEPRRGGNLDCESLEGAKCRPQCNSGEEVRTHAEHARLICNIITWNQFDRLLTGGFKVVRGKKEATYNDLITNDVCCVKKSIFSR